jgi:hypothetical protein
MVVKKMLGVAVCAILFLSSSSFALLSGWTAEGKVGDVFIGAKSAYDANYPIVIFSVVNTNVNPITVQTFSFALDGTDAGKSMLSQIYVAKTNGWWVQIANDGRGKLAGYLLVNRFVAQQ